LNIRETVLEVLYAVVPIIAFVSLLQLTVVRLPTDVSVKFLAGSVMVILGLAFFLLGVKAGFLPIGELIGSTIVSKGKLWLLLSTGFVLGFVVTVADPSVQVLAAQIYNVSEGTMGKPVVVVSVALGVGIFLALALLRILLQLPITRLLTIGYLVVFALASFTSPDFVTVSFDAGWVATGPMTVPFVVALGVGVASVAGGRKRGQNDSFGLVALACIGPSLAVLIMRMFFR